MAYTEKAEQPVAATQDDLRYLRERITRLEDRNYEQHEQIRKKIKFIVAVMIDKGLIGAELAKQIQETEPEEAMSKVEWLLQTL